jgi:hypothetical protein
MTRGFPDRESADLLPPSTDGQRVRGLLLACSHDVSAPACGDEEAWRPLAAAHFSGTVLLGDNLTSATVSPEAPDSSTR